MKTIFLVTSGYYSDYSVRSVWTTRDLAESEMRRMLSDNEYKDIQVEEFFLDAPTLDEAPCWRVDFGFPWLTGGIVGVTTEALLGRIPRDSLDEKFRGTVYVQAATEEQAIKVATERRQQAIQQLAHNHKEITHE